MSSIPPIKYESATLETKKTPTQKQEQLFVMSLVLPIGLGFTTFIVMFTIGAAINSGTIMTDSLFPMLAGAAMSPIAAVVALACDVIKNRAKVNEEKNKQLQSTSQPNDLSTKDRFAHLVDQEGNSHNFLLMHKRVTDSSSGSAEGLHRDL